MAGSGDIRDEAFREDESGAAADWDGNGGREGDGPDSDGAGQDHGGDDDSGHDDPGHDSEANDYQPLETERLALEDDDDRLPWLDSDEDEYEANDSGRVLGLAILGLVALGTIVGGIWWATHRTPDKAMVADGGLITAPAQPYKEAPKNPGGKTFEGTGDTAFAVSEGQSRPAKLGEASGVAVPGASPSVDLGKKPPLAAVSPKPGAAAPPAAAASAAARATSAPAPAAPASGPVVQVGAYSTRAIAEAAWSRMTGAHSALSGQRHQVIEGKADIGTVYRLQVITADASGLCRRLKASGLACQVK